MSAPLLTDQAGPPTKSLARPWAGLLVLATTIFVVVTTELLPVGLLTPISDDLGVARSRVGLLVTVYAFTVGLTAAPLTHWTAAWPRKRLYMTVSAAFSLGTVLSAAAESYPMLAIGRFLCGMAHGVFWSIVAGYAAALAKPGRSSRTTAIVFAGNSAALVLGVPLGTVLGNVVGWRGAFCAAAALGLGALAAAQRLLPDIPNRSAPPQSAGLGGALRLPGLRSMVTATALLVLGHFTVYTYVTPLLHDAAAFSEAATSMLLALYGLAGFLGTWLGGVLGDPSPAHRPARHHRPDGQLTGSARCERPAAASGRGGRGPVGRCLRRTAGNAAIERSPPGSDRARRGVCLVRLRVQPGHRRRSPHRRTAKQLPGGDAPLDRPDPISTGLRLCLDHAGSLPASTVAVNAGFTAAEPLP
ncbi:MFS transporter [Streptomyces sp. H27-C3]|uniref:MFS transporter n=1 Tax=Streptomyces sp. H27-C3 TaxID=3046305 RepID=UPI0024BA9C59|nr:MFS transporter [Streptomyces sp. H27-C3]MDJ0462652.1 MFS transporter [Streptomyces sp. H27-C3]